MAQWDDRFLAEMKDELYLQPSPEGSDEDTWAQIRSFRAFMFLHLKLTW